MARITLLLDQRIQLCLFPAKAWRFILFLLIISSFFSLLISCTGNKSYEPQDLRKLNGKDIIERAKKKQSPDIENITIKDSTGHIITNEEFLALNFDLFGTDQYADSNGLVTEVVIRKIRNEDLLLREIVSNYLNTPAPIEIIDIDCSQVKEILNDVYKLDQQNRQNGAVSDQDIDLKNQQLVVSIIEQCGFPTLESHGYSSLQAIFLVIQHANKTLRKRYFPEFKRIADQGAFSNSTLALMEDRILMDDGQKQIYGTQVHRENGESEWKLYPLADPSCVNERRSEVGLGPLEDYLKNFGINYQN